MDEKITVCQCQKLREAISEVTQSCLLTKDEYVQIIKVIIQACFRIQEENLKED